MTLEEIKKHLRQIDPNLPEDDPDYPYFVILFVLDVGGDWAREVSCVHRIGSQIDSSDLEANVRGQNLGWRHY